MSGRSSGRGGRSNQSSQPQQAAKQEKPKGDKPYAVFRIGDLKLSCWLNEKDHSKWFACKLARVYKVNDKWEQTDSLNDSSLLHAAELLRMAYIELRDSMGSVKVEFLQPDDSQGDNGSSGQDDEIPY